MTIASKVKSNWGRSFPRQACDPSAQSPVARTPSTESTTSLRCRGRTRHLLSPPRPISAPKSSAQAEPLSGNPHPHVVCDPPLLSDRDTRPDLECTHDQAVSDGPVVQVVARCHNEDACISVTDRRIGMPFERLAGIVDMSKRLHSAREYEGTGLGLSICCLVAELHGGQVNVTAAVGKGSCFTLQLPLMPAEPW